MDKEKRVIKIKIKIKIKITLIKRVIKIKTEKKTATVIHNTYRRLEQPEIK